MSMNKNLQLLRAERDALLQEATALIGSDERVAAAWLYGSLGRSTDDEWSDIDLWVTVADSHIEEICASRYDYVVALGEPLLVVDAPQNAPPGGAFLTVLYKGRAGSRHVDWTWQRQLDACVPSDARVLFNRGGVPVAQPAPDASQDERDAKAVKQVTFFWMMVPVVAKYVARRQPWAALDLLNLLRYTVEEVEWLVGVRVERPSSTNHSNDLPPVHPDDQLGTLEEMARVMETYMSSIPAIRTAVSREALEQVYRHMCLAQSQAS